MVSSFSSSSTATSEVNPKKEASIESEIEAIATSTGSSLPWRSSPVPLGRVVRGEDFMGLAPLSLTRVMTPLFVSNELSIPLWQYVLTNGWRTELGRDFEYSFQKGVAGLLSWKYQVPIEMIECQDGGIVFDSTKKELYKSSAEKDENDTNADHEFSEKEAELYVKGMLEPKLIGAYRRVPDSLRFEMKPLGGARIENLFVINALTRGAVDRNPSLKGCYTQVEQATNDNDTSAEDLTRLIDDFVENTKDGSETKTVIADVTVNCLETLSTPGMPGMLQKEPEEVTHLVRFEMETKQGYNEERKLTSWRIVDWDDMLGGNLWA